MPINSDALIHHDFNTITVPQTLKALAVIMDEIKNQQPDAGIVFRRYGIPLFNTGRNTDFYVIEFNGYPVAEAALDSHGMLWVYDPNLAQAVMNEVKINGFLTNPANR